MYRISQPLAATQFPGDDKKKRKTKKKADTTRTFSSDKSSNSYRVDDNYTPDTRSRKEKQFDKKVERKIKKFKKQGYDTSGTRKYYEDKRDEKQKRKETGGRTYRSKGKSKTKIGKKIKEGFQRWCKGTKGTCSNNIFKS